MTNTERNIETAKDCGALVSLNDNFAMSVHFSSEQLNAYTARICAEKDAEIANLREVERLRDEEIAWLREAHGVALGEKDDLRENLSAANAAIAMKDEALKEAIELIDIDTCTEFPHELEMIHKALSTTPESIAAWEAEKLLPLQRQVAMQADYIKESLPICGRCDEEAVGIYYYHEEDGEEWCCEDCHKAKKNFFSYGGEVDEFVVHGLEIISNTQATAEAFMNEHAASVMEKAASKFRTPWNGDSDTYLESELDNETADVLAEMAAELRAANNKENG